LAEGAVDRVGDFGEMLGLVKKPKAPPVVDQPFPRSEMTGVQYPTTSNWWPGGGPKLSKLGKLALAAALAGRLISELNLPELLSRCYSGDSKE
jgi:hypothetical protein